MRDRRGPLRRPRAGAYANRLQAKHAKVARTITTLADYVGDTKRVVLHRGGTTTWAPLLISTNPPAVHSATSTHPAGAPTASMPSGDHLSQPRSVPPKQAGA